MARAIGEAFVYFMAFLAVLLVPASILGVFGLATLGFIPSVIFILLTGFLVGLFKRKYLDDNITTMIVSAGILGFLNLFLEPGIWIHIGVYLVGYLIGRRMKGPESTEMFEFGES
ncbi:MAG: hypothetical protein SVU32_02680 [Candidatus Nanohaloarchaea archaeon]|nr:hypothetical protein [Candidatus Nanohaloarchaea archaeon]